MVKRRYWRGLRGGINPSVAQWDDNGDGLVPLPEEPSGKPHHPILSAILLHQGTVDSIQCVRTKALDLSRELPQWFGHAASLGARLPRGLPV